MHIDKKLNLVVPLDREDGSKVYVHSAPLGQPAFETYHLVLAKTFAALQSNGLGPVAGPSVAAMVLKTVAQETQRGPGLSWWEGADGVENGLLGEVRRLSNVVLCTQDGGWSTLPLQLALGQKLLSEEEAAEVLNQAAFFIVVSAVAPRLDRPRLAMGAAHIFDAQTTSLNSTEFAASLRTPTEPESIGERAKASSIPR